MKLKNLIAIACIGRNGELGAGNDLIWKFKEDLQTFKNITMGSPMVMGLNTYHSLPGILPGRKHLVIADRPFDHPPEVTVFTSLDQFLNYAQLHKVSRTHPETDIFVIGGGMIYEQLLPFCDRMILTHVDDTAESCEVFFPTFDANDWTVESTQDFVSETGITYKRVEYRAKPTGSV